MNDYNLKSLKSAFDKLVHLVDVANEKFDHEQYDLFVQALVDVEFVINHKDDV